MNKNKIESGLRMGDPAFPASEARQGITTRDYLAALAMNGILAGADGKVNARSITKKAYKIADAMEAESKTEAPDRKPGTDSVLN